MTILLDDILRTTVNATLEDGTLYQNVFHHKRIGASGISDAAHITAIQGWVETVYATIDDQVENSVVSALSSVDKVEFVVDKWEVVENIGTFTWTFVPTVVGSNMPNQIAPFVIYKTARPKTVGRKFLFPMTEDGFAVGIIVAATMTDIAAWAAASLVDIYLGPIDDLELGVPRTGIDAFYTVNSAIVTNIAGTQRRRRLGYGA